MKILYSNNNALEIPRAVVGTAIQIRQWLRGEQYVPFLKSVFNKSAEPTEWQIEQGKILHAQKQEELTQEDINQLRYEDNLADSESREE
jgi:hypothetical protein